MSIIADSVQVFPDGGGAIRGHAALEATYRDLLPQVRFDSLSYVPSEVRDCGGGLVELGEARGGVTPTGAATIRLEVRYLP